MRIIHQIARCLDCGQDFEGHINSEAYKKAYAHSVKTGHRVQGETGTSWTIHKVKSSKNKQ